ncbi:MAG: hypothetical protein HC802_01285 [Caldilineaceae bacterium]|nr:hypothetical protein [Caldilineaceae bacterium]
MRSRKAERTSSSRGGKLAMRPALSGLEAARVWPPALLTCFTPLLTTATTS